MKTRLTDVLGIDHPVMLAGMGGVSYAPLVTAVSEAGGFGCLGASTMSLEQMVSEIAAVRGATDKPFGVDLLTAMPGDLVGQVEQIIEGGASVFVAGLGVPAEVVELCHRHKVLVVNMCGKVDHARRALDAGCDVVVAQGTEAGGHTGPYRHHAARPPDRRRRRRPHPGGGGRWDLRRARPGRSPGPRGRRGVDRHPVHRHPRGPGGVRLQGRAGAHQGGRHHHQPGLLGQDHAGGAEPVHRPTSTSTPTTSARFRPSSAARSGRGVPPRRGRGTPRGSTPTASATRPGRGWGPSRP